MVEQPTNTFCIVKKNVGHSYQNCSTPQQEGKLYWILSPQQEKQIDYFPALEMGSSKYLERIVNMVITDVRHVLIYTVPAISLSHLYCEIGIRH